MESLSYLMGAEEISDDELNALNITIADRADSGSRMLKIPEESLPGYIEIIKTKMTRGFWNEIIGPKSILFIFKFEDGHIEEYALSPENERKVDQLCERFNNELPHESPNVYRYLSENDFYHDFMLEHWAEMIHRQ